MAMLNGQEYDVAADLATLRRMGTGTVSPHQYDAALDRVEAEIARLTQERDEQATLAETRRISRQQYQERAEAAEAEVARLRDGLREIRDELRPVMTYDGGTNTSRYGYEASQRARALLAEDGAARTPPRREYGGYMGGEPWGPDHPSYDEMGQ